jgi:hypothetical protein
VSQFDWLGKIVRLLAGRDPHNLDGIADHVGGGAAGHIDFVPYSGGRISEIEEATTAGGTGDAPVP